jgi:site-specific recombinase XerD
MTRQRSGQPRKAGRVPGPTGMFVLADGLSARGHMAIESAVDLVRAEWAIAVSHGEVSAATVQTHGKVLTTFTRFVTVQGAKLVCDIDAPMLQAWTHSFATRSKTPPTTNTVALRQSVARSLYRTFAKLGITDQDITVAVPALRRPERKVLPLTESQVTALKKASLKKRTTHSGSSKAPAAIALALLGLQSKEIPATRVRDIDFLEGTVFAHDGGHRFYDRHVPIDDPWAYRILAERVQYLQKSHPGGADDLFVAYEEGKKRGGSGQSNPAAATSNTIDGIFRDAGVKQPGRVRIASLNEYVALRVYQETGSLVEVAVRLGMSSLDAVAHIVDDNWLDERLKAGVNPSQ